MNNNDLQASSNNRNGFASPSRSNAGAKNATTTTTTSKSVGLTSPVARQSSQVMTINGGNNGTTATVNSSNVRQSLGLQEEKTAEERAEEKKKMDMMKQFYRNRHASFL